jgi:hypothetical protein
VGRPLTPSAGSLAHDCHDPRHQPDRTARQITTNLVSARITTGDVARLAGSSEKATRAREGKKEGRDSSC